jgi:hypothetical protein
MKKQKRSTSKNLSTTSDNKRRLIAASFDAMSGCDNDIHCIEATAPKGRADSQSVAIRATALIVAVWLPENVAFRAETGLKPILITRSGSRQRAPYC